MSRDDDSDHDDDEMTVSRLEDDTEEITIREGEGLTLGCQVIAGSSIFKYKSPNNFTLAHS